MKAKVIHRNYQTGAYRLKLEDGRILNVDNGQAAQMCKYMCVGDVGTLIQLDNGMIKFRHDAEDVLPPETPPEIIRTPDE